jgi:serine/threonine protein kinase
VIGQRVGHFEIQELLGRGGNGEVYRAVDSRLGRPVALKILSEHRLEDDLALARFRREARNTAALNHPGLAALYDADTDGRRPYLVLEFVEGTPLHEFIRRDGPLPVDRVIRLGIEIGRALAYAHERGFIHRDVKSPNIMVTPSGGFKLLDLGLTRHLESTLLTKSGLIAGSAPYISPEQALDREVTPATDIWSLGVVLYEALTGRLPFPGKNIVAVLYGVLHEEPKPPGQVRSGVPEPLERVILDCLRRESVERPGSVLDVVRRLERPEAPGEGGKQVAPERPAGRTPPWWAWLLGAIALGLAGVLAGALITQVGR